MGENYYKDAAYKESDMEVLMNRGEWNSWGEAVQWLHAEGEGDIEFTGNEVEAMIHDLSNLENKGVDFTRDPKKAYELAQKQGAR